ncbi:MAG: aminotransferase class I/II-fold pyridoxal phosphate-dependent enzyme [Candidatus Latescibacteria bacterium]|nr:aminotransferase class I/II-fold pyridoxal phosphate-dependent enzyme [Candidatus Latescibacterota bacterium]
MYRMGEAEVRRVRKVIQSGRMFRYYEGAECATFERDWAKHVGVKHARLTTSGTTALYAALVGLGIGPGCQVIVPSYTYMATALAVLAAGAIPVVADVDESLTLSPKDVERRITKYTKAIIPVHMVGLPSDMDKLMRVARKHNLLVIEDACQAVGGGYKGKKLGSFGHATGFSFNFFKNISAGEGGGFVTNDEKAYLRGSVAVDCCAYYWNPDEKRADLQFAGHNFRATEFSGALLNVQLTRLDDMLDRMRSHKQELLQVGLDAGLRSIKNNSLEYECGTHLGFYFKNEKAARAFCDGLKSQKVGAFLPMDTGRHVYTRWDPILRYQGAHHPALDPFKIEANKKCRVEYTLDMCQDSLDILNRAVLVGMHPDNKRARIGQMAKAIRAAAKEVVAS